LPPKGLIVNAIKLFSKSYVATKAIDCKAKLKRNEGKMTRGKKDDSILI